MTWKIEYGRRVPKSLARLPLDDHRRIVGATTAMQGDGQLLRNQPTSYQRRVGNYRILFDLDLATGTVLIHDVVRRSTTTYRR
jgi:mRNA-degrading endonuclease RelE of RelBE toxin-antitoxin system